MTTLRHGSALEAGMLPDRIAVPLRDVSLKITERFSNRRSRGMYCLTDHRFQTVLWQYSRPPAIRRFTSPTQ